MDTPIGIKEVTQATNQTTAVVQDIMKLLGIVIVKNEDKFMMQLGNEGLLVHMLRDLITLKKKADSSIVIP